MSKLVQFDNSSLDSIIVEVALTTDVVAVGSAVEVTVDNNDNFSTDDYVIIGEIGSPQANIAQVASVSGSNTIVLDVVSFPRGTDVKIHKLPYNQIRLSHSDTESGVKSSESTVDIDVNDHYTSFLSTRTSGFFFFSLYNETTTDQTSYTHPITASGIEKENRMSIYNGIKGRYGGEIADDVIFDIIDTAEHEIMGLRRWAFSEGSAEFTTTVGQSSYDIVNDIGITDLKTIIGIDHDGDEMGGVDMKTIRTLARDGLGSGEPRRFALWGGKLYLSSIPAEEKTIDIYYYKASVGFTNDTLVSFPQAIIYRVLEELWATEDRTKSAYYSQKLALQIKIMKKEDQKYSGSFGKITYGSRSKTYNPLDDISISV